jgi:hypothetical protein
MTVRQLFRTMTNFSTNMAIAKTMDSGLAIMTKKSLKLSSVITPYRKSSSSMLMPDGFAVLVKAKASIAKPMATTIPVTTMLENNYDLVPQILCH